MSTLVRVRRHQFPVQGMGEGTLHALSVGKVELVLRESPTTSVMTVDSHDLAASLDPRPAEALLSRAITIAKNSKQAIRIVVSQYEGELIYVLMRLGFARTAPIEPERIEFTKKFV